MNHSDGLWRAGQQPIARYNAMTTTQVKKTLDEMIAEHWADDEHPADRLCGIVGMVLDADDSPFDPDALANLPQRTWVNARLTVHDLCLVLDDRLHAVPEDEDGCKTKVNETSYKIILKTVTAFWSELFEQMLNDGFHE
jgi:hypothetical protein